MKGTGGGGFQTRSHVQARRALTNFNCNFNFMAMRTVTMLEFRRNAEGILRRVARGERLVLSHRGRPAARLEPVLEPVTLDAAVDPFLNVAARAKRSPRGPTAHLDIDRILYGDR